MRKQHLNFPLVLTLIRLIVSPLVLPLVLAWLLPYNSMYLNFLLSFLFFLFGVTDFFDGYLARKYQQETTLGSMLDPMADKFLFYSVFVTLVAFNKVFFYWAIIFIGREFFIMGLRMIALEEGFKVPVSSMGKWKTTVQTAYVMAVIAHPHNLNSMGYWNIIENILLVFSLFLSLFSAYTYYEECMRKIDIQ